jgi:ribosomal protein L16 Arg81 hydroxylase
MSQLAELIQPVTLDEFFRTYWEQRVLYCRHHGTHRYANVLTPADLDDYFQRQQLHPARIKVVKNGSRYPAENWTQLHKSSGQPEPYYLASASRLFSLYAEGATLVLDAAEGSIPQVTMLCESLACELNLRVQANIYVTPPDEQGFRPHIDDHDVLVLQISGSKRWRVYEEAGKPTGSFARGKRAITGSLNAKQELDLQPGDCLYVPSGAIHDARSLNDASIHITLGLHTGHWFDLLKELSSVAEKDPVFGRTLPHGLSSDKEKADFEEEFLRQVRFLMARNTPSVLYVRTRSTAIAKQPRAEGGRFTDLLKSHRILPGSVLCRRPGIAFTMERYYGQLRLRTASDEIRFPFFLEPALQVLSRDQPFAVREIGGMLSESGKVRLATHFVQAGLVSIEAE